MRVKSCPIRIKAAGTQDGTGDGVFEALVATYDLDSYGDKILPGAFADTLDEWKTKGDPIPVIWSHMAYDPDMHIGVVLDAEERENEGLWVKAQLDLEQDKAAQVYRLMKGRRVTQFSFMYDVDEGAWVETKDDGPYRGYYELRKISLYEVGPCLVGVNENTELLDIKGRDLRLLGQVSPAERAAVEAILAGPDGLKAGRVLSSKNETSLREALASINTGAGAIKTVLAALEDTTEDDDADEASDASEQKASESASAPTTEASPTGPATDGAGPAKGVPASILAQIGVGLAEVDTDLLLN